MKSIGKLVLSALFIAGLSAGAGARLLAGDSPASPVQEAALNPSQALALGAWMADHILDPNPSQAVQAQLASAHGLSEAAVHEWFEQQRVKMRLSIATAHWLRVQNLATLYGRSDQIPQDLEDLLED